MKHVPAALLFLSATLPAPSRAIHADAEADIPAGAFTTHYRCQAAARDGFLSRDRAALCSAAFLRVKLHFVADVAPELFSTLPPKARAAASRTGYLAFKDWEADNPEAAHRLSQGPATAL
ncbi:hypothetical protein [Tranquillimonas alkanivorans]|uniref:Uncharacterized protein n=1 Tax=Tranquillimonas alkanivorans TaxID=441119 RepID=A0A1I5QQP4_9RHOB|nr:hypothetical protein [Tranquillimonas alkanivorans]SFP48542.1 hypothetical protein SAMN04488047_10762 [Tranquillimonas alkanivorans]